MTSPPRTRTEPGSGGFLRSVMRSHGTDGLDDGMMMLGAPEKQVTQEEQDVEDKKARKQAMGNLINSWQERLQLISVITTFFASTEAALLVNAGSDDPSDLGSNALMATNACLIGALLLHVYASVLSFLGAFLLISYKLKEATREEMILEGINIVNSPSMKSMAKDEGRGDSDPRLQQTATNISTARKSAENSTAKLAPGSNKQHSDPEKPRIISTNPRLEPVGPFTSHESSHLFLSRTHALCVFLAATGFLLAIAGIMCYVWATQPKAVSIFASLCLGGAGLAMGVLLI